jgi:glutamyl-tRNA reductase
MHILCLGINHTTAPLALREKLFINDEMARHALGRLTHGDGSFRSTEMVIVSTCNRVELYTVSDQSGFTAIEDFLSTAHGISFEHLRPHIYHYSDEGVVDHLFRLSAGLDSLVLGEPQILGQVTRALELSLREGACGPVLSRLFRSAIHTGKRAHTETAISRNPASVSSLAASLAAREVHDLPRARILVVGAGEMAELAVEALHKRGAFNISVLNRTLERAQSLASRWQAQAFTFDQLDALLTDADIVITSTSSPLPIIDAARMQAILPGRARPHLVMIDIAVPRDIDAQVGTLPGVKLFDLDHLEAMVASSLAERQAQVPLVEAIIAEEKAAFLAYLQTVDVLPMITHLRQQAEDIRIAELDRTLRKLPDLTETERQRIEAMSRAIVKKLLASPTQRLRDEAACPHAAEYTTVARTLFDLPGDDQVCAFSKANCPKDCASSPLSVEA